MTPTAGPLRAAALDAALEVLACPLDLEPLARDGASLVCAAGHRHDVARQGYAALAPGTTVRGDPAPLVEARRRFLEAGHFAAVTAAVVATVPDGAGWCVDLAGGPGHHLVRVLEARPALRGVGLDVAPAAARAAAGAHPRLAAATADLWRRLPLRDASVAHALGVFAPRNGPETARVLAPGAALTVVTPLPHHLAALRAPFGTIGVGGEKERATADRLAPLRLQARTDVEDRRVLDPSSAAAAVLMGPSGHHLDAETVRRTAEALGPVEVDVAVSVATWRR